MIFSVALLFSCSKSEKTIETNMESGKSVISFSDVEFSGEDHIININDVKECADTIDFRVSEGPYMGSTGSDKVRIKIPSKAELVDAEVKVSFYPTLWNDDLNVSLIELIYLYDLPVVITKKLPIKDGYFVYKYINSKNEQAIKDLLNSLSSDILIKSISKVPVEYSKKERSIPEIESWKTEEKEWIKMAKNYDRNKNIVEINPYEEEIILTYRDKDGKEFQKVLKHTAIVGN